MSHETRESYRVTASDLNGLLLVLNAILVRIADRLDKIEGLRGELETEGGTFGGDITVNADVVVNDSSGNKIHSME